MTENASRGFICNFTHSVFANERPAAKSTKELNTQRPQSIGLSPPTSQPTLVICPYPQELLLAAVANTVCASPWPSISLLTPCRSHSGKRYLAWVQGLKKGQGRPRKVRTTGRCLSHSECSLLLCSCLTSVSVMMLGPTGLERLL